MEIKIQITGELENLINTEEEIKTHFGFRSEGKIRVAQSDDNFITFAVARNLAICFFNIADKCATRNSCEVRGI